MKSCPLADSSSKGRLRSAEKTTWSASLEVRSLNMLYTATRNTGSQTGVHGENNNNNNNTVTQARHGSTTERRTFYSVQYAFQKYLHTHTHIKCRQVSQHLKSVYPKVGKFHHQPLDSWDCFLLLLAASQEFFFFLKGRVESTFIFTQRILSTSSA